MRVAVTWVLCFSVAVTCSKSAPKKFVDTVLMLTTLYTRFTAKKKKKKVSMKGGVPVQVCHVRTCRLDTAFPLVGGLMPSRHVVCMS